jgi:uncharacterized protein YuzE
MSSFSCPFLKAEVQLTDERERHIEQRHPDLLPDHRDRIGQTLADPDQVRRSSRFVGALLSRWFADLRGGKYVVVVVDNYGWPALDCHGIPGPAAGRGRNRMGAKLSFQYDRDADILYINKCAPYPEQESEELGDDVVARLNPKTGDIENLEVLFFSTRLLRSDLFELPVTADLRRVVET